MHQDNTDVFSSLLSVINNTCSIRLVDKRDKRLWFLPRCALATKTWTNVRLYDAGSVSSAMRQLLYDQLGIIFIYLFNMKIVYEYTILK